MAMIRYGRLSGLALAASLLVLAPAAQAQTAENAPAAASPAEKTKQGFWYKLCDKQPQSKRQICFTFHEQVNVSTGRLFVSAAVRKVTGSEEEHLLVVVPPGVAVRPGLQVQIDKQSPIILKYIICQPKGCTAEGVAGKKLVQQLIAGKTMMVAVIDVTGQLKELRVPLAGFKIAYTGAPVDKDLYFKAWRSQIEEMRRKRQAR